MFLALLIQHRGDLGRVPEQRTNLPLGAAKRKALQGAGQRKEEQKGRTFPPGADAGAAKRNGEHKKVHVDGPLSQSFPNVLSGEPTARDISQHIPDYRHRMGPEEISA